MTIWYHEACKVMTNGFLEGHIFIFHPQMIKEFFLLLIIKVRMRAKIRNRCNQVPPLTQDTNKKVTDSQLDITNESQQVSPVPADDHKASINRRAQKHNRHKREIT